MENIKEEKIKELYNYAVDKLGEAKFEQGLKIDITSKDIKGYLNNVYDIYSSKNLVNYYETDVKKYIDLSIKASLNKNGKYTINQLIDSLISDTYEKRVSNKKVKVFTKRNGNSGRKHC